MAMITNNPGHLKGFSYVGLHRYSLTFRTDGRRRVFTDGAAVDLVVQQLLRAASEQKFSVIAYCFMPDHLHLLIEGTSDNSDGRRFIKAFKQYSGYYYSQARNETLWQRYGFEHVLRDDELTVEVVRYILGNPVRAGLARTVEEYPYVGSLVCQLKDLINSTSS
jgi:putative transposase